MYKDLKGWLKTPSGRAFVRSVGVGIAFASYTLFSTLILDVDLSAKVLIGNIGLSFLSGIGIRTGEGVLLDRNAIQRSADAQKG